MCGCGSQWNGCMHIAWDFCWGGCQNAKQFAFFSVTWLELAMKGGSVVVVICLFLLEEILIGTYSSGPLIVCYCAGT